MAAGYTAVAFRCRRNSSMHCQVSKVTDDKRQMKDENERISMHFWRAFGAFSVGLLVFLNGCGGGGFDANRVVVTVSPSAATVAAGGSVSLQATITGLCSTCSPSINTWTIS